MTTLTWDALGGNPAPGETSAYDELARSFSQTAGNADSAHGKLNSFGKSVDDKVWKGPAADAFRGKIGELPPRLAKLHDSYAAASGAMAGYSRSLADLQSRAARLLGQAQAAHTDEQTQQAQRQQAQTQDPTASTASYDQAIDAARQRFSGVQRQIDQLREDRVSAETATIGRLQHASDLGMHNDPWWKHAWDSVSDWVDKHVDLLKEISSVLKMVSAVAGLLSFIPFLSPICGPLAMIAGGLALGIDFVLCATGHGDWKAFAIDAALMALPVAGHFASEAIMARQAGRAVGEYADEVRALDLSSRQRPGDVAALRTRNAGENLFRGASKPQVELNPRIQSALDRVPEDVRSPFHGKCAEIKALNNAANADARLKGSVIATSKVRKLGNLDHGAPHEPCGSCQHVLDQLGVKYVVGR